MFKRLMYGLLPLCFVFTLSTQANAAIYEVSMGGFDTGGSLFGTFEGEDSGAPNGRIHKSELTSFSMLYSDPTGFEATWALSDIFFMELIVDPLHPEPNEILSLFAFNSLDINVFSSNINTQIYHSDGISFPIITSTDDWIVTEISSVPIPGAIWLFGTALVGLVGFSKRRKSA